jgi:hypothetical protein
LAVKVAVVLTFDVPDAEAIPDILTAIDPPRLPHFDGEARVVPPPYAAQMTAWLDEG